MIRGVIFDFDGVLVDSHDIINNIFSELAKEINLDIDPDEFGISSGSRFEQRLYNLTKKKKLNVTKKQVEDLVQRGRLEYYMNKMLYVKLFPGAKNLLDELQKNKIKIGLGTNGSRNTVIKLLKKLEIENYFESIVTYDDVAHGKPAPDMFLKNAETLKLNNSECLVVEDSAEGIEAAKHAGMDVIAVQTTLPKEKLNGAKLIVPELKYISLETIKEL